MDGLVRSLRRLMHEARRRGAAAMGVPCDASYRWASRGRRREAGLLQAVAMRQRVTRAPCAPMRAPLFTCEVCNRREDGSDVVDAYSRDAILRSGQERHAHDGWLVGVQETESVLVAETRRSFATASALQESRGMVHDDGVQTASPPAGPNTEYGTPDAVQVGM